MVTKDGVLLPDDIVFHDVRNDPFTIHGLYQPKTEPCFHRMPDEVAEATSKSVAGLQYCPAGGRVRFKTDSKYLCASAIVPDYKNTRAIGIIGAIGFDVYMKRGGRDVFIGLLMPQLGYTGGDYTSNVLNLPEGMKEITVNLPHHNRLTSLLLGLSANAVIEKHSDYRYVNPVFFYGSSITQGGCALRSGMTYENQISRRLDCDYVNFGFSGACRGEDAVADYMASLDYSVFVCDYDHNAPNPAHLEATHEKLYLKIRAAHPDVPVIFVTRPATNIYSADAALRRDIIYRTYSNAMKRGENVTFIDGGTFFAGDMREDCTVDGTHPNDLGMTLMANSIGHVIERVLR